MVSSREMQLSKEKCSDSGLSSPLQIGALYQTYPLCPASLCNRLLLDQGFSCQGRWHSPVIKVVPVLPLARQAFRLWVPSAQLQTSATSVLSDSSLLCSQKFGIFSCLFVLISTSIGLKKSASSTYKHCLKKGLKMPFLHEQLFELGGGQATSPVGYEGFGHVGEIKCSRLWDVLLVCWLFEKGRMCILGKLRLGRISMECLLCQPWDFLVLPDRQYLRGSGEQESYSPGILFYVGIKPEASKHSKNIVQQTDK